MCLSWLVRLFTHVGSWHCLVVVYFRTFCLFICLFVFVESFELYEIFCLSHCLSLYCLCMVEARRSFCTLTSRIQKTRETLRHLYWKRHSISNLEHFRFGFFGCWTHWALNGNSFSTVALPPQQQTTKAHQETHQIVPTNNQRKSQIAKWWAWNLDSLH